MKNTIPCPLQRLDMETDRTMNFEFNGAKFTKNLPRWAVVNGYVCTAILEKQLKNLIIYSELPFKKNNWCHRKTFPIGNGKIRFLRRHKRSIAVAVDIFVFKIKIKKTIRPFNYASNQCKFISKSQYFHSVKLTSLELYEGIWVSQI